MDGALSGVCGVPSRLDLLLQPFTNHRDPRPYFWYHQNLRRGRVESVSFHLFRNDGVIDAVWTPANRLNLLATDRNLNPFFHRPLPIQVLQLPIELRQYDASVALFNTCRACLTSVKVLMGERGRVDRTIRPRDLPGDATAHTCRYNAFSDLRFCVRWARLRPDSDNGLS